MATANQPNLTGVASIDLGMGGELRAQVAAELKRRKRKGSYRMGQSATTDNALALISNASEY